MYYCELTGIVYEYTSTVDGKNNFSVDAVAKKPVFYGRVR